MAFRLNDLPYVRNCFATTVNKDGHNCVFKFSMNNKIAIIGAGFSGLSAACSLAVLGHKVTVFEKNETTGGRARTFHKDGFMFDMGPSWYWMPDIFDAFFEKFGKKTSDYYTLERLDPSYRVFFKDAAPLDVPAELNAFKAVLNKIEPGAGQQLDQFLKEAQVKYEVGMNEFVWKPSLSFSEYLDVRLLQQSFKLQLLSSMSKHIRKFFSDPKIVQLLEFPVLFLGAKPSKTPALYSMMNYADIKLGTWYPQGGMVKIPEAMTKLAIELGVEIRTSSPVDKINISNGEVTGITVNGITEEFDAVVGSADYHHIESALIDKKYRSYSDDYWESRVMSPSSLLFYIGVDKKVDGLLHHNLFFDENFEQHAEKIYDNPDWPDKPLFYVCCPSKTDATVAPEGKENLFLLIPVAPGMSSDEKTREALLDICIQRIEKHTGSSFKNDIIYKRSYAHEEFISDYNSFKGNAYGLANTLTQTAFMKPRMKSKKVSNLFYTGQLTVPGPGVPPSLISGQVVATEVTKYLQSQPVTS